MYFQTLHHESSHRRWDRDLEPVLCIEPTALLEFQVRDASDGQLTPGSTKANVSSMDRTRANPLVGPVYVEGAEPGDAIEIEFLDFQLGSWGWTAIFPGLGLLQKDFPEAFLHISTYDEHHVEFTPEIYIPTRPFAGTVGLAPSAPGSHSVIPPRRVGGNLDCRDLVRGSKLLLPVEVAGGLLSIGDTHAAQGDGEVCGTAIETSLHVQVRVRLLKQEPLRFPRAALPGETTPQGTATVTMGVGPDLMHACQDAIREMIDHIVQRYGLSPELAYCLCSAAASLRLSEVVDAPNWVVTAHLPNGIFRKRNSRL